MESQEVAGKKALGVCPHCGGPMGEHEDFCRKCGKPRGTPVRKKVCPHCGAEVEPGQTTCSRCYQSLDAPQAPKQEEPIPEPAPQPVEDDKAPGKRKTLWIAVGAVLVVVLALVLILVNAKPNLKGLYDKIVREDASLEFYFEISEDGKALYVDTNPYDMTDYINSEVLEYVEEIHEELDISDVVYEKMLRTSAMDGMQSQECGKILVTWTYHPDEGLEVIYEVK